VGIRGAVNKKTAAAALGTAGQTAGFSIPNDKSASHRYSGSRFSPGPAFLSGAAVARAEMP